MITNLVLISVVLLQLVFHGAECVLGLRTLNVDDERDGRALVRQGLTERRLVIHRQSEIRR